MLMPNIWCWSLKILMLKRLNPMASLATVDENLSRSKSPQIADGYGIKNKDLWLYLRSIVDNHDKQMRHFSTTANLPKTRSNLQNWFGSWNGQSCICISHCIGMVYSRGGQQIDRDRPGNCQVSVSRSRLILHWIDKIPKKTLFNQYSRKYKKRSMLWLVMYSLVPLCDGWP